MTLLTLKLIISSKLHQKKKNERKTKPKKQKRKRRKYFLTALRLTANPKNSLCFQKSYLHKKDNISTVLYKIGSTTRNNILNYKDVVNSL